MTHILMVAAENAALPNAKVGGIGDVVRDVPAALARRGCEVSVVIPSYGYLQQLPGADKKHGISIDFGGKREMLDIYQLTQQSTDKVHHYVIDHALFASCGIGRIYCDDPPGRPFARDATKFALFCAAVAASIQTRVFGKLDVLHLHDWHAAFLLILRRFMPAYKSLQKLLCAYTIHNLALQGVRPFEGDDSSLKKWFPAMKYDAELIADPRWTDCVNPMASAIRLADTVHAVSPGYAAEIQQPTDIASGHHGGEGLEQDLIRAHRQQRLFGILNGCVYAENEAHASVPQNWPHLVALMRDTLPLWISREDKLSSAHFIASLGLEKLSGKRPKMLITSVGRITDQKLALMRQPTSSGKPALHAALEIMAGYATFLIIGSGDADYERFLTETAAKYGNIIYLRGYSDELANAFYQQGDLFFMPSSFEPCGISQMLALRAGQLCLVHGVGGLRDTVVDGKTGYVFNGTNPTAQAEAMLDALRRAIAQHQKKSNKWQNMRNAAAAARFDWADSIDAYLKLLYRIS